jgi:hypothetical protein
MKFRIVRVIGPCSLVGVLVMHGCVTPQDAMENAERALRKTEDIQAQHNALEERADRIEQNAKSLEQKMDADSLNGLAKMREALISEAAKNKEERDRLREDLNNRLHETQKQIELLRADLLNAIQSTNGAFTQRVDKQLASMDHVVGTLLLRIQELEKRLQTPRKK